MLRLVSQDIKYQETIDSTATEQIGTNLNFGKRGRRGYINKGTIFYIMTRISTIKKRINDINSDSHLEI
jgi:hypothetical protein